MAKLVIVWRDAPPEVVMTRTLAAAKLYGEAAHNEYPLRIVSIHAFHTKWVNDILTVNKTKPYYRLMKKGGWAQL